jgi:hypothetical protein
LLAGESKAKSLIQTDTVFCTNYSVQYYKRLGEREQKSYDSGTNLNLRKIQGDTIVTTSGFTYH